MTIITSSRFFVGNLALSHPTLPGIFVISYLPQNFKPKIISSKDALKSASRFTSASSAIVRFEASCTWRLQNGPYVFEEVIFSCIS